jgi:hypothetical protein
MNKKIVFTCLSLLLLVSAGFTYAASATLPNPLGGTTTFPQLLNEKILPALSGLIAAISVIMFVIAGILYLTSAGDPGKVGKAKTAVTYAVIGIVIAISATAISAIIKETLGVVK